MLTSAGGSGEAGGDDNAVAERDDDVACATLPERDEAAVTAVAVAAVELALEVKMGTNMSGFSRISDIFLYNIKVICKLCANAMK